MQMLTGRLLARLLATGLLGAAIGLIGTGIHRLAVPWGLVLALLTVLSAAVLARAWVGGAGVLALALGLFAVVGLLGGPGPGGDVLVALEPVGVAWYLGALAALPAFVLPRRWFADTPRSAAGADRWST